MSPFSNKPVDYAYNGASQSGWSIFVEEFGNRVNPADQWNNGNHWSAAFQTLGWGMFVVGTAGAGFFGTAGILGGGTAAYATSAALTTTALTAGAVNTYVHNPNAGMHEYAFNMGLNALNPIGGTIGLAGGGIGYGVDRAAGGSGRTGYLAGDFVGGLIGFGVDDVVRATSRGASLGAAAWHATRQVGVTSAFAGAGFGAGYASTGTLDGALFWGNIASMPGNMIAKRLVPCFRAGTPIRTPDGNKVIEQLKAGDFVLSRDESNVTGHVTAKVIEEVFIRTGVIFNVHVGGEVIETTPEHPFYVKDKGWTAAGELEIGDLLSTEDGEWLPVEDLLDSGEVHTVYNLRVADYHTYFVGRTAWRFSVWVHNTYNNHHAIPKVIGGNRKQFMYSVERATEHMPFHNNFAANLKATGFPLNPLGGRGNSARAFADFFLANKGSQRQVFGHEKGSATVLICVNS